jgi:hypothetical protein
MFVLIQLFKLHKRLKLIVNHNNNNLILIKILKKKEINNKY